MRWSSGEAVWRLVTFAGFAYPATRRLVIFRGSGHLNAASATDTQKNRIPLLALLCANAISMIGNMLTMIAIPWFVLQTTGSASKTGLAAAVGSVPLILAGLFGGALVDRLGFKRTSVISDLASGITVALIPIFHHTIGLSYWQLLVLVFLGGLLDTPGSTARMSLVPDVARLGGMSLERANSLFQAIQRGGLLVGPPLSGILIAMVGASNVLWFDAATFAVSALVIALAMPVMALTRPNEASAGKYLTEMLDGLRFVRGDALILAFAITFAISNFVDAHILVILPVFAERVYGSAFDLGLMVGGFGAGSLVGAILFMIFGQRLPRRPTLCVAFIIVSLPIWVLTLTPSLPVVVAALFVTGIGSGPINPIAVTVLQERVPAEMRGRIFGLVVAMVMIASPIGRLQAGFLIEWIGINRLLVAVATGYLLITLGILILPTFRALSRMPPAQEAASAEVKPAN